MKKTTLSLLTFSLALHASVSLQAQTPATPRAAPADVAAKIKAMQDQMAAQLKDAQAKQAAAEAAALAAAAKAAPASAGQAGKSASTPPRVVLTAEHARQISSMAGAGGLSVPDLKGKDLETAMVAIQTQRANLLESQLRDQMTAIQARNDQIQKLNQLLTATNKLARLFKADANSSDPLPNWPAADKKAWQDAASAAGVPPPALTKKADVDGFTESIKSKIDSLNNSQQMDMLRMQSLTNKRNEAFETMTNFIKKIADNRSSVLGNMR